MIIKFPIALVLLLMVICTSATPVYGQAYCALRDPVSQIYELFPQATSYKSVVRTVDEQARRTLKTKLPFDIHFNEFGRHTLYVALKGSRPVGLVHVRSEKGRWGLIEVAWALDFNLTILDFRFQRCRSASRKTIEAEAFRSQLIGKKWHEVEAMLSANGQQINASKLRVPVEAQGLAKSLLHSALKTILVTESTWVDDLRQLRMTHAAFEFFPDSAKVERVKDVYTSVVIEMLEKTVAEATTFNRESTQVLRAFDANDQIVGLAVWTSWTIDDQHLSMWWKVSPDLRILEVVPEDRPDAPELVKVFHDLKGQTLSDFDQCATAVELAGTEILTICAVHAEDN